MGRWEPNAQGRLEEAALDLFSERGYEATTVAEIAERAGVTERTFFRHFTDKREVLFRNADAFQQLFLDALGDVPADAPPMEAVGTAIAAGAAFLEGRRDLACRRQRVIVSNPELSERERIKLASLATAIADVLVRRGAKPPAATLAAEMGVAVFRIAFGRWIEDGNGTSFTSLVREGLTDLQVVTGALRK